VVALRYQQPKDRGGLVTTTTTIIICWIPHDPGHPSGNQREQSVVKGQSPGPNPSRGVIATSHPERHPQYFTIDVQEAFGDHREEADSSHSQIRTAPIFLLHYLPAPDPRRFRILSPT
jgi:hypothetical protein